MALQITEVKGIFSIHGILNGGNAEILNRHISMFINPDKPLVVNLERLKGIDPGATHALRELYLKAMRSNSILSIIGRENKNILSVFKKTNTTYILSNDRV